MHRFDDLDARLVSILRQDGRAPVAKLAQILGISRATVQVRLDRLLDTGTILGFTIRVREDSDRNGVAAIMMIEVAGRSATAIIQRLRGLPEIRTMHTTNGSWDLVVQVRVETLNDLDRLLGRVRSIDGILNSETSILLSSI